MPQSMSKTQIQRFTRICEDQGIRVTRTKKGLLLRFPDGSSTVQHFTNSDVRAEPNQIARFRRAGMTHPNDTRKQKDELPAYITSGTISPKTRQRIIDYVVSQGFPEAVLSSSVVKDLKMDPGWANRALYHSGFRPGKAKSRKVGRPWYTPEEILCLKEDPNVAEELAQIVDDEPIVPAMTEDVVTEETEPTPEEEAAVLESLASPIEDFVEVEGPPGAMGDTGDEPVQFVDEEPDLLTVAVENTQLATDDYENPVEDLQYIDTRDSWVPDMNELLGGPLYVMVKERLQVLKAVGIDFEIRVWRTTK